MTTGTWLRAALLAGAALLGAAPAQGALGGWSISRADEERFALDFVILNRRIYTEICRKDEGGRFLEPEFANVRVPAELSEAFTTSALKRYFRRVDAEKVRGWMSALCAPSNWQWTVALRIDPTRPRDDKGGIRSIAVSICNVAPLSIRGVTLYVHNAQRTFDLVAPVPIEPRRDVVLYLPVDAETYAALEKDAGPASIRRIWW